MALKAFIHVSSTNILLATESHMVMPTCKAGKEEQFYDRSDVCKKRKMEGVQYAARVGTESTKRKSRGLLERQACRPFTTGCRVLSNLSRTIGLLCFLVGFPEQTVSCEGRDVRMLWQSHLHLSSLSTCLTQSRHPIIICLKAVKFYILLLHCFQPVVQNKWTQLATARALQILEMSPDRKE